jgi:hypothetical protein
VLPPITIEIAPASSGPSGQAASGRAEASM